MFVKNTKKKFRPNEISAGWNTILTFFMMLLAIVTIAPLILVVVISFTSAESMARNGYRFVPEEWSVTAYTSLIKSGSAMVDSYLFSIFYASVGTLLSLFVMSMCGYALSIKSLKGRKFITFYIYFTCLFSGGLVPSYILNTMYLHLNDTIWIYLLPGMVSAFNVIILRTFIQSNIPESLFDAAKIDGASEWKIYCRIVLPLSKAGLATVGLWGVVGRWNDWFTGILYIENPKLTPIMTFLQRIQNDLNFLKNNSVIAVTPDGMETLKNMPTESTRMAITIIAILPLLVAYPFFQKYFVKGITVGSVKG